LGANGVRRLGDGQLVLNNSTAGGLFSVGTRTGVATVIPVPGGSPLVSGDALELRGNTPARRPLEGDPEPRRAVRREPEVRRRLTNDDDLLRDPPAPAAVEAS